MKKSFATVVLCFFFFAARSQFGPVFFVDTLDNETISQVACADFNHDGLSDILTSVLHWPNDRMQLYLQTGDQEFVPQFIPAADSLTNVESFDVGDVFQDGWTDFIVVSEFPWYITLYENNQGTFIPHIVDDSLDFTSEVRLVDFNHDGLLDILSLQHIEIVVYLAISEGVFGPGEVIHSGTEFYAIDAAQYNQDTFTDVAVASDGFEILLNDGTGHFTLHSEQGLGLDFGLESADMDADGDMDIAVYRSLSGILFYANDGDGHFSYQRHILESTDNFFSYVLTDMDCDADVDLYTSVPQTGHIIIVENDGNAHFDTLNHLHTQTGELVRSVATGDLNNDGKQDPVWGYFTLGAALNECTSVSVDERAESDVDVLMYPNPSDGVFTVVNHEASTLNISVFDMTGRRIIVPRSIPAGGQIEFSLSQAGVYYVQMINRKGHVNIEKIFITQ